MCCVVHWWTYEHTNNIGEQQENILNTNLWQKGSATETSTAWKLLVLLTLVLQNHWRHPAQIATTAQTFRRNIASWTRLSPWTSQTVIPIGRWWASKTKTKQDCNDSKIWHWIYLDPIYFYRCFVISCLRALLQRTYFAHTYLHSAYNNCVCISDMLLTNKHHYSATMSFASFHFITYFQNGEQNKYFSSSGLPLWIFCQN